MAEKQTGKSNFFSKLMEVITGSPSSAEQQVKEQGQFAPVEKESKDVRFVKTLTQNGGNFVYCGSKEELVESLIKVIDEYQLVGIGSPDDNLLSFLKKEKLPKVYDSLKDCDTICTYCEALIASNGGIMVNERQTMGIRIDDMPDYHIVIGKTSQLVENLHGAMAKVNRQYRDNRPGQISVLKGPNDENVKLASADPNKDRTLFLLLVEDTF